MNYHFPIQKIDKKSLNKFKIILRKYYYTSEYLVQMGVNPFVLDQTDLPILAYRLQPDTPFGILFHLFFLGQEFKLKLLTQIFSENDMQKLLTMNILEKQIMFQYGQRYF